MSNVIRRTAYGCVGSAAVVLIARSPASAPAVEWDLSLGAGVGVAPDYEGSDEYEAVPVLLARINYGKRFLELRNTTLRANILSNGVIQAGPVINYRFERDDVDSSLFGRSCLLGGKIAPAAESAPAPFLAGSPNQSPLSQNEKEHAATESRAEAQARPAPGDFARGQDQ